MATTTIDGVEYDLVPTSLNHTTLLTDPDYICTVDGFAYFLGEKSPDKMSWFAANTWAESFGAEFTLPNRQVLLGCAMNDYIRDRMDFDYYWSSSWYKSDLGWKLYFRAGTMHFDKLVNDAYAVAVRKVSLY